MRRFQLEIEFAAAVGDPAGFFSLGGPEVALVGRSNVGKSSFLNALAGGRKVARTSRWPGRTRAVNLYRCGKVVIGDLPGYGFARVSKEERNHWKTVVESYLARREVRVVVQLVDARIGPTPLDRTMAEWLLSRRLSRVILLTKADLIRSGARQGAVASAAEALAAPREQVMPVSALTREGVKEAWGLIESLLP